MNIGTAARESGLPTKTVRYYADIGLVAPHGRAGTGYRAYGPGEIQRLQLVRRARAFGFSVEECRFDVSPDCPILNGLAGPDPY